MTQTATQITIAEFRQTVSAVAHDLRAEREHYGKTWEEIDDLLPEMCETEWCIYSSRAEELVEALMAEDREAFREALAMYEELWDENWSTSGNADYRLAYCATEIAVRAEVEAMKAQDFEHRFAEALDWIVSKARRDLFDLRDEMEYKLSRVADRAEVTA